MRVVAGFAPKVTANDSKYNARGITHNSGTAARSVLMNVVTPIVKLEGTKATAAQSARLRQLTVSASACVGSIRGIEGFRTQTRRPQLATITSNVAKPAPHSAP